MIDKSSYEVLTLVEEERKSPDFEIMETTELDQKLTNVRGIVKNQIERLKIIAEIIESDTEINDNVLSLIKSLSLLNIHAEFISLIIESKDYEEIDEIKKRYSIISNEYTELRRKSDICYPPITHAFDFIFSTLLSQVESAINNFFLKTDTIDPEAQIKLYIDQFQKDFQNMIKKFQFKNKNTNVVETRVVDRSPEKLSQLVILKSKLETTIEYIPFACIFESDDILGLHKNSQTWKELLEEAESKEILTKDQIDKSYKMLFKIMNLANALIGEAEKEKNVVKKYFNTAINTIKFAFNEKLAQKNASLFLSEPKLESAFKSWAMLGDEKLNNVAKIALPFIEYEEKIYVERLFPTIDRNTILQEYENNTINKIEKLTYFPPDLAKKKKEVLESLFLKDNTKVGIRILSPKALVMLGETKEKINAFAKGLVTKVKKFSNVEVELIDEIVFHIHGGGFVAFSSATHRNHTIPWANSLNRVVFSVDYGLAPEFPYPCGLDDIWQAYNWIVNYSESILGIKAKKIVVTGDSAGGNLSLALTLRAIKSGIRVPDGCFLSYPALNLHPKRYSPSFLLAIEDTVLPYAVLKLCIKAYSPEEYRPGEDPFISPVVASDELLEKLPPVIIVTGTADPLHDDVWRFLARMKKLKKYCKVRVYQNIPHGFLSYDMIEGFSQFIKESTEYLKNLFEI